jgi:hypothetical protein
VYGRFLLLYNMLQILEHPCLLKHSPEQSSLRACVISSNASRRYLPQVSNTGALGIDRSMRPSHSCKTSWIRQTFDDAAESVEADRSQRESQQGP